MALLEILLLLVNLIIGLISELKQNNLYSQKNIVALCQMDLLLLTNYFSFCDNTKEYIPLMNLKTLLS